MIKSLQILKIWLFFFLAVSNSPDLLHSQSGPSWRIKNRLQTSYEYDDNIRESPDSDSLKNLTDSSYKILFHSRASRKTQTSLFRLNYHGGLQNYFNNSIENKLINELSGYALFSSQNIQFGLNASGRLKIYLNDILDSASGSAEAFLVLPKIYKLTNKLALKTGGLDYKDFSIFNYRTSNISWTVSRSLNNKLSLQLILDNEKINFDRNAIDNNFDAKSINSEFIKQSDDQLGLKLNLNYTKSLLVNFSYLFKNNNSNSFGYSYNKHQFVLILGLPLTRSFWLRGYGTIQIKKYDERSLPVFLTDIDTEREESNFFILDISKDISPNLSGLLRMAFYNNESTIRSRFYNKLLLTGGIDFRF